MNVECRLKKIIGKGRGRKEPVKAGPNPADGGGWAAEGTEIIRIAKREERKENRQGRQGILATNPPAGGRISTNKKKLNRQGAKAAKRRDKEGKTTKDAEDAKGTNRQEFEAQTAGIRKA